MDLLPGFLRCIKIFVIVFFSLIAISCSSFTSNENAEYYRSNPGSLFYSVLQRSIEIDTFEGYARLTVESPSENFQGNAKIFYRQPDSLLVQIQAGFGVSIGNMLVIGDKVQLYNIRDRILYKSEGADVPLDDLIGMSLRVGNLIEAVLGLPRPPDFLANVNDTVKYNPVDDKFKYYLNYRDERKEYIADPKSQVFEQYTLIYPGNDTTICNFKQFRRFKNVKMPQHIQITRYHKNERLALYYTRMQVNKKIPKNRFQLKISDNVDIINLTGNKNGNY